MVRHFILFVIPIILLSGCGLPGAEKRRARNMGKSILRVQNIIAQQKSNFKNFVLGSNHKKLIQSLSRQEEWEATFTKAEELLDSAIYLQQQAMQLVEANEKESLPKLKDYLTQTWQYLHLAETIGQPVLKELSYMENLASHAKNIADSSFTLVQDEKTRMAGLVRDLKNAEQFGDKVAEIQPIKTRLDSLHQMVISSSDSIILLVKNWEQADTMNLRTFSNLYQKQTRNHRNFLVDYNEFRVLIDELSTSTTRILTDMRLEYYVQIGRTSWDNYSDYNTDKDFYYPAQEVSEDIYEYFEDWGDKKLASLTRTYCDENYWYELYISKRKNLLSRHDAAEFWINDLPVKYYHQYLLEENGDTIHTGWREISEAQFFNDLDNLGMATYAKPLGFFETEAHRAASPPGMVQVGNPQYGEWKEAEEATVWHFFPAYAFFTSSLGPDHHYTKQEHQSWKEIYSSKNKPYYGSNLDQPIYGTWREERDSTRRNRIRRYIAFNGWNESSGGGSGSGSGRRGLGSRYRGRGPGGSGK